MPPFKILIFTRTTAYRHASIPAGIRCIQRLASSSLSSSPSLSSPHEFQFTADATEDPTVFTPSTLSTYRVIVLLQCSGDDMLPDPTQLDALQQFVRSGGGVVGVHCASFAMRGWEWYGKMIGGVFANHPEPQRARVRVVDQGHYITSAGTTQATTGEDGEGGEGMDVQLKEGKRMWMDEWYNFTCHPRGTQPGLHVLLTVDEGTYSGGEHGEDHPITWCHEFEGGRVFYTALGHFDEAYEDEWFTEQLRRGIIWAAKLDNF
ncbi:carboxylesterase-like protein [Canariomyces notabilis]|uniref:Carboxylesterase-like protein n=1 Tax=Canariomyces notabilis TaxID=2074819 RepID=A0AAN6TGX7_9PEZI|nr:carboxylesterase-like protein [Canariomyces arenarius]